jgi:ferric-dicitrate binding protein FerR (iron transport regulator)
MSASINMSANNKKARVTPTGYRQGIAEHPQPGRPERSPARGLLEAEDYVWMKTMESLREAVLSDPECTRELLIRRGRSRIERQRRMVCLAMCCLAALSIAIWLGVRQNAIQPYVWSRFDGDVQQITPIRLADGSVAQLNGRSRMWVRLSDSARQIVLDNGEVFFDVSPDPTRPFDVKAGSVKVHATGTAFAVRKDDDGQVEAAVRHGVVELQPTGDSGRSPGASAQPPEVRSGQVATIGADGTISVADVGRVELTNRLAWADPVHRFDGVTLQDAVALFNKYNVRQLEVHDPELGRIRITGGYHLAEPEKFAESLQALGINHVMQGLQTSADARILLLHK